MLIRRTKFLFVFASLALAGPVIFGQSPHAGAPEPAGSRPKPLIRNLAALFGDKCVTCHWGGERRAPEGDRSSRQCREKILVNHLFPQLGCTVCHGGNAKSAKLKKAHGKNDDVILPINAGIDSPRPRDRTILAGVYVQASCGKCHLGGRAPEAPILTRGRELFKELGCVGCHRIKGHPNDVGVDLTGVGLKDINRDGKLDMLDREWIFRHFKDPAEMRENSWMANFALTDQEATALTVLMLSFTDEPVPGQYLVPAKPEPQPNRAIERGRRIFELWGCAGCHGRGGRGGIKNPNMKGGQVPALYKLADTIVVDKEEADKLIALIEQGDALEADTSDWLKEYHNVKKRIVEGKRPDKENPHEPPPPLAMPAWREKIRGRHLDDLMAYILALFPEDEWESWDQEPDETPR